MNIVERLIDVLAITLLVSTFVAVVSGGLILFIAFWVYVVSRA